MAPRLSSTAREKLWDSFRQHGEDGTREDYPRCNIPGCGLFVTGTQKWAESHYPVMKTNGGTITGIAHHRCNFLYWCTVEAPMLARSKKARRRHIGARIARRPLPGGRDDPRKRKIGGGVVDRRTGEPWRIGR